MSGTTTCATPRPTCSLPTPLASEIPMSFNATELDSHTVPIIFGTIGVILASMSLVVNIAFGTLQLRATNRRARNGIEVGKLSMCEPVSVGAGSKPDSATVDAAANYKCHAYQLGHELDRLSIPTIVVPVCAICVCVNFAMFTNTVDCSQAGQMIRMGLLKSPYRYNNQISMIRLTSLREGNIPVRRVCRSCRPTWLSIMISLDLNATRLNLLRGPPSSSIITSICRLIHIVG
jgi:hypothetical protein